MPAGAWGSGAWGLGRVDEEEQLLPREFTGQFGGCKAVMLAAGGGHTMTVTEDGALWACGMRTNGSWAWATSTRRRCAWGRGGVRGVQGAVLLGDVTRRGMACSKAQAPSLEHTLKPIGRFAVEWRRPAANTRRRSGGQ